MIFGTMLFGINTERFKERHYWRKRKTQRNKNRLEIAAATFVHLIEF